MTWPKNEIKRVSFCVKIRYWCNTDKVNYVKIIMYKPSKFYNILLISRRYQHFKYRSYSFEMCKQKQNNSGKTRSYGNTALNELATKFSKYPNVLNFIHIRYKVARERFVQNIPSLTKVILMCIFKWFQN